MRGIRSGVSAQRQTLLVSGSRLELLDSLVVKDVGRTGRLSCHAILDAAYAVFEPGLRSAQTGVRVGQVLEFLRKPALQLRELGDREVRDVEALLLLAVTAG